MEGRGQPEGNPRENAKVRTQSRGSLPSALTRVAEVARGDQHVRFTSLLHHVDVVRLRRAFQRLRQRASPGIDGQTVESYAENLSDRLEDLCARVHTGRYRALPVRRVYIPKTDGGQRPLGIPALEDKIVQGALGEVLSAIYEVDFLGLSYGFRPGRSPHRALKALHTGLMTQRVNYVLDADIRGFLDAASYCTPFHGMKSNRFNFASNTLIRNPLRLPRRRWTASSSPRFTRCNTV